MRINKLYLIPGEIKDFSFANKKDHVARTFSSANSGEIPCLTHRMKSIVLLTLFFFAISCLLSFPAYGQAFRDLDSLKREFMRGMQRPNPTQKGGGDTSKSKETKDEDDLSKTPTPQIKFLSGEELMARSNVAFINPDTYRLAPGDYLKAIVYGRIVEEIPLTVQSDGTVFVQPAGSIYINGKTISQAREKIYRVMCRYYRNFRLKLEIARLRTVEVRVLGEVANPGTYIATPVIGACDIIGMAGGVKKGSSLRNIVLKNAKNQPVARIDLFAWYYLGDRSQNHDLDSKYVVFVPVMGKKVKVDGAFQRKGEIEIVPGERIRDLIKMADTATGAVLSEARLVRIINDKDLKMIPVNLKEIDENPDDEANLLLTDGDELFVPELDIFLKKIRVVGELKNASTFAGTVNKLTGESEIQRIGLYNLKEGEKVKDVVAALGGLTVKADGKKAVVERPMENGNVEVIPINLDLLLTTDDQSQNIAMKEGDTLIVPSIQDSVYLLGEIRSPGAYQYNVGNRIKDYIALAGGPTKNAKLRHVRVIRERNGHVSAVTIDLKKILYGTVVENEKLRPGDVVYVPYADLTSWRDLVAILTDLVVLRQLFRIGY